MSLKNKPWWIKERFNPQLGVYYVACGQMSVKDANACKRTRYGCNEMMRFNSEEEYRASLEQLKKDGMNVQDRL
jgi:hypothetical protein